MTRWATLGTIALIRLMLRFGFWAFLAAALVPGLKHADVFKSGVNSDTINQAYELTKADLATVCVRNPSACEAGQLAGAAALDQVKAGFLAAYQGIRTQYDEPDAKLKTGSIPQK